MSPLQKIGKDTVLVALSAEYDVLEWLAVRAGVSYETSPLDEKHLDYLTPTNGRFKAAVGAGINKPNWSVDLAYVFTRMNDLDYANADPQYIPPQNIPTIINNSKAEDMVQHNIVVSLAYKF